MRFKNIHNNFTIAVQLYLICINKINFIFLIPIIKNSLKGKDFALAGQNA